MSDGRYKIDDVIRQNIESVLMNTYTSIPAIVESFNPTKQTVNVKVAVETPTRFGANIPPAILSDVLVVFPAASDWVIAGPIKKGDAVALVVPHYGTDSYMEGDSDKVGIPTLVKRHDLNDAFAIVGMTSYNNPKRKEAFKDKFHIAQGDNNSIVMDESGGVVITAGSSTITMTSSGAITIVGNVEVTGTLTNNGIPVGSLHTHPYTDNGSPLFTGTPI